VKLKITLGETLKRHATRPQASQYGAAEMRDWYRELDLLPGGIEQVVPAETPQGEIERRIMADSRLAFDGSGSGRGILWAAGGP
jgi:hypothetical protein